MVQKFDEFLEEVEQDIRHERFEKYWRKYGKLASGAITGILAVTALYMLWGNNRDNKMIAASETLVSAQDALSQNKQEEGLSLLRKVIKDSPGIYPILSRFALAAELSKDGETKNVGEAVKVYTELEKDSSVDRHLRDLATILRISLEFEAFGSDQAKVDSLRVALESLTKDDNPLHLLAMEIKAVMLFKAGALHEAAEVFIKIAQDQQSPDSMRTRAQLMTQMIASKPVK